MAVPPLPNQAVAMSPLLRRELLALLLCAAGSAVAAADDAKKNAAEACEAAVAETIRDMRGRAAAQDVQFIAARRVALPKSAEETAFRGEGRYRGSAGAARPFTYSCAYDASAGTTSGVVFRETGGGPAVVEKPWEPDLSRLSPEACETAVASAVTQRYRQAGRISFLSDTRQLKPATNRQTALEGDGLVERAPGMNPIRFTYRCEIDARGKVTATQIGG